MPDGPQTQGEQQSDSQNDAGEKPADFEAWLAEQDDDVRTLYESHTTGLKSALKSERERNAELAHELRDAATKATGEAQTQLDALATKAESEAKRGDFYEAAHSAGCTNLRLAYIAAREIDAFDRKGQPDVEAVKAKFPELFAVRRPPDARAGHGAAGDGGKIGPNSSINQHIRQAAGKVA